MLYLFIWVNCAGDICAKSITKTYFTSNACMANGCATRKKVLFILLLSPLEERQYSESTNLKTIVWAHGILFKYYLFVNEIMTLL